MIDTPILPNMFRLFDIQREKQENLEKCSSCNDDNEENSDEETKDEDMENSIQEGMTNEDIYNKSKMVGFIWAGFILISYVVCEGGMGLEKIGGEIFNKVIGVSTKGNLQNIVDGLHGYNDEASKVQKTNSILTGIWSVIITILIIFVPVIIKHPENMSDFTNMVLNKKNYLASGLIAVITGVTCWLYTLSKPSLVHSVIDSIENTIGYIIINFTGLNLREYMTSKSFEKWADEGEGKSIILNFNPLITLFSLYNMDTSFVSMANDKNTDFTLKEGVNEDAFKHIFRFTAIKRLISQFAIMAMTGSIAVLL